MPASASRYLRPSSSQSQTPSPRTKATCCRAYVFMMCDIAFPQKQNGGTSRRSKNPNRKRLGKALQALLFGRLQHPDARQVALVHDAVHLHAARRAQKIAKVLGDLR